MVVGRGRELDLPAIGREWHDHPVVRDEVSGEEWHWGQTNWVRLDPAHGMARWRVAHHACLQNDVAALDHLLTLTRSHPHFGLAAADGVHEALQRWPSVAQAGVA